jgi:hypothetical protein
MFTGVNDCSRIMRGAGSDLFGAELEVLIRAMTGEAYTPELLALPRGVKALCEDQAMRTAVLASLPTLDEGGLAVRQVGGDPNHEIRIPGNSPESHQRADRSPGGSCHGGPAPAGKEKVPEFHHNYNVRSILIHKDGELPEAATLWSSRDHEEDNVRSIPIRKDDEVPEAATSRSSRDREEDRSRRLHRGDGSYVGEPAPKCQKTAKSVGAE